MSLHPPEPSATPAPGWWALGRPAALVAAAALLSATNALVFGIYHFPGILVLVLAGLLAAAGSARGDSRARPLLGTMAAALAVELAAGALLQPDGTGAAFVRPEGLTRAGLVAALVALGWLARWPGAAVAIAGLLGVALWQGAAVIRSDPQPAIDVWRILQDASGRLLHGRNPYVPTYPTDVAGLGVTLTPWPSHGQLAYPPGALLAPAVGRLFSDVRWAFLGCSLLAAGLAAATVLRRKGKEDASGRRVAVGIAALLLSDPFLDRLWRYSWTEPQLLALAAALFWCWQSGRPALAGAAFGVMLASKQYVLLLLPFAFLLTRERRFWVAAGAAALACCLPFIALDAGRFWSATVAFHLATPFRTDSLSLIGYGWHCTGRVAPDWLAWPPILAVGYFAWRQRPPTFAGFLRTGSLALFIFFSLARQAFGNYYHLVGGMFVLAAAATWLEASVDPPRSSR